MKCDILYYGGWNISMAGYSSVFAQFYDALTSNIKYGSKADFLLNIANRFGCRSSEILDLACGTGSLSIELARRGRDVIAIDASPEMLAVAAAKSQKFHSRILYLCQEIEKLELHSPVELSFCVLDSLNHLKGKEALVKAFKRVSRFIEPGGLFIFDMNTPYKHREVLGNHAFIYEQKDFICCWQNDYRSKDNSVFISLDFFVLEDNERYHRMRECFWEYCYTHEEIVTLLQKVGFEVLEYLGDYQFRPPCVEEERVIYVTRRQ